MPVFWGINCGFNMHVALLDGDATAWAFVQTGTLAPAGSNPFFFRTFIMTRG